MKRLEHKLIWNQLWVKSAAKGYQAAAIAVDATGHVYIAGNPDGYVPGIAITKYDTNGHELWMKNFDARNLHI